LEAAEERYMVSADDVTFIYLRLAAENIPVWLTGGWGIDALLWAETRPHKDLDFLMLADDVVRVRELLATLGYQLKEFWSENSWVLDSSGVDVPTAFLLQDPVGRQIDLHAMRLGDQGNGVLAWNIAEGLSFRMEDLAGNGTIAGVSVPCITAEMQARCHTGYDIPDFQMRDMRLLSQNLGISTSGGQSHAG
jgi:lincosamide nucleotidyltransferase A/C/D/E